MSRALVASGLSKSYAASHGPVVLSDVSLELAAGEAVAITGASGCGKSTLLHILGGLTRPDAGSVSVAGTALGGLGRAQLGRILNAELGFVYQFHHLLAEFTAAENVAMPLLVAGVARGEALARAGALLGELGLGERGASLPAQLSGGERQRVAIARALANRPLLVIADEPTGNLDSASARGVAKLLLDSCRERDCALIVATHDAALAASFARVLQLDAATLSPKSA